IIPQLLDRERIDLNRIGRTRTRIVRSNGPHAGILRSSLRGDMEVQTKAWQFAWLINDSPVSRLRLQLLIKRKRLVQAADREARKPGVVVRHAPERHTIKDATQAAEGFEVVVVEPTLLRNDGGRNRATIGAEVGGVVSRVVHADVHFRDLLMKVWESFVDTADGVSHRLYSWKIDGNVSFMSDAINRNTAVLQILHHLDDACQFGRLIGVEVINEELRSRRRVLPGCL